MTKINPAHLVKAINLYPGSGEYLYEINPVINNGYAANIHNDKGKPDVVVSIEHLKATMPNLEYISVMIDWFSTSLNAAEARIIPKVESNDKSDEWQVAGYTRKTAEEMNYFSNGEITFGGTPTDRSIVELCSHLKELGYKVMLSPLLMVDDESLTKPWRGFISANSKKHAQKDIEHFFNGKEGYNKFIMHYAKLEYDGIKLKDVIDSFVIGSELKGLTSVKVNEYLYPAVHMLKGLAESVRAAVGPEIKITYSANWGDEYHNINLDPLWCDKNIDWVGVSAYFPITDNLSQDQITYATIKNGWSSGEGIDYYKNGETKEPYNDQNWAWKNVEYWWDSYHMRGSSCWTPKMKPVIFTEYGFSSIDAASNQPSFYYDSSSGNPPKVNNEAQSVAIAASEMFFAQMHSKDVDFLPFAFLYVWDARPYPDFPNNCIFWSDCKNHQYGHAVNGKFVEVDVPQEDLEIAGYSTSHVEL